MKKSWLFLLLTLVLALSSTLVHAQDKDGAGDDDDDDDVQLPKPALMKPTDKPAGVPFACPYEKDFQQLQKVGGYKVRLLPVKVDKDDKDDKDNDGDPRCRAVLLSAFGRKTLLSEDWALSLDKISGVDMNGDGKPEIVLDGYSGGLHCCYTYMVISLSHSPQVLHQFKSQVPMTFEKQADGTTLIRAADGVFDYFLVPHTEAVIPRLILKMEGNNLVDVSASFPEIYDQEIQRARSQLTSADLEKFRKANYHDKLFMDQVPTMRGVLTVVLDYVYSGREQKAWEALNEFWPVSDASRVKSLILERRNRGLLANLGCDCRSVASARRPPIDHHRKASPKDETTDPRDKAIIDD